MRQFGRSRAHVSLFSWCRSRIGAWGPERGYRHILKMTGLLATKEGLFVGPSSGANVAIATGVAKRLGPGRTVVTVLPDVGDRYLRAPK